MDEALSPPLPPLNGHEKPAPEPPQEEKPLYHIYLARSKGKSFLRVANVYSVDHIDGGAIGAWESRSTARWWAKKITKESGERFLIIRCEEPKCPVCKRKREELQCQAVSTS